MEPDDTPSFGILLRRYRIMANLSQAALAERAGLSTAAINTLERGVRQSPRLETVRLLAEALALDPEQRERLSAAARQLPTAPSTTGASPPEALAPTNMPQRLTRFVGRANEITELCGQLRRLTSRLLTLVGPPGVGKTRLGMEIATHMTGDFPDGIFWIPLAAIREPELVLPTIAQALGQREVSGVSLLQSVCAHLRPKQLLLLLDNFEQVVDAAPIIGDILGQCARVVAIVTSRAPLHLQGEQEYAVAPLDFPAAHQQITITAIQESSAVTLFVQRAQAVKPDFQLTTETAPSVVAICQSLDGLPLAIELAAARVKMMPVPQLLQHLKSPLTFLIGGPQDMPVHQQTLRTTLAWSYDLLAPHAQRVFRQMAIFAGGATFRALASVLDDGETDLLNHVANLIDHSLVIPQDHQGEARFNLLVTIRDYGLEVLTQMGEIAPLQQRYAAYFLDLAEATSPKLAGAEQQIWLEHLEVDQGNYRAVLHLLQATNAYDDGLRLGIALWPFWKRRGYLLEGRQWLETFIAQSAGNQDPQVLGHRAAALNAAGSLAWPQGDYLQARILLQESLTIYRQLGNQRGVADALNTLAIVSIYRGEVLEARSLMEESLALRRTLNDSLSVARTLNDLGTLVRDQGEDEKGRQLLEESLALLRVVGDISTTAAVLNNLGSAALHRHDFAQAQQYLTESLAMKRELGNTRGIEVTLLNLGELAYLQGHYAAAYQCYTESLALGRQLGDKQGIAESGRGLGRVAMITGALEEALQHYQASLLLSHEISDKDGIVEGTENIAQIVLAWGQKEQALALFAAASALRRIYPLHVQLRDTTTLKQDIAAIQAQMTDEAFAQIWAQGEAWSLDEAVRASQQVKRSIL